MKDIYGEQIYDLLTRTDTSLEILFKRFCKLNLSQTVMNYAIMSEDELKSYMFDFFLELRAQTIPVKDYYIEYFLTATLVKRMTGDIKSGKITGSERFIEIYCNELKKPKHYLLMKMMIRVDFDYFYYKYFLLMDNQKIRDMFKYFTNDEYYHIKNRVHFLFKDESEAFYTAHHNYNYIVNKCHKQQCKLQKDWDKIVADSYKDRIGRYFLFRMAGVITGMVLILILYFFLR